jgi:type 1 glutamine amidotransferase
MTQALILSGGGEYGDPWHPFAETSDEIAQILREVGVEVEVAEHLEERAAHLDGIDLLVSNAAAGPVSTAREAAHRGIRAYLARGGGVVAVHVGAATLLGLPEWESVTGMAWVDGTSMHPKLGPSHVRVVGGTNAITAGLDDFDLTDERYCNLRMAPDVTVLVSHDLGGATYPLVWSRQYGASSIVVDTLGHNAESFASSEHRQIIARSALWAAGQLR